MKTIVLFLLLSGIALAQQPEGAMGNHPLPPIVGMSGSIKNPSITIDVIPKMAVTNPYKRTTFRVRIRIPEDDRNRVLSYTASCGSEIRSSQKGVDAITFTHYENLTVLADCEFQACVHSVIEGKVKNFCTTAEVKTPKEDEP